MEYVSLISVSVVQITGYFHALVITVKENRTLKLTLQHYLRHYLELRIRDSYIVLFNIKVIKVVCHRV